MVIFGQKSSCFRAKVFVLFQKWLYSGKSGSITAKVVVIVHSGKSGCIFGHKDDIPAKVLLIRANGCIRAKCCCIQRRIRAKVVVFGQGGCGGAKVVLFGQKLLFLERWLSSG